ncbi:MAG: hypothetical protein LBV45_04220 [Xanthomonadaceae bacterium]|nr:hypothetical protein [Xanthomonadaceae bacterium]
MTMPIQWAAAAAAAAAADNPVSLLERSFEFDRSVKAFSTESSRAAASEARRQFAQWFGDDYSDIKLAEQTDDDLQVLYDIAEHALFVTLDPGYIENARRAFEELQRRNATNSVHLMRFYDMLAMARMFPEAQRFAQAHPEIEYRPLPGVREENELPVGVPTVLKIDADAPGLVRVAVDDPMKIVAIVHPQCGFALQALGEIERDPLLASVFADALWITPPSDLRDFEQVRQWNHDHPASQMTMMYRPEEWPEIDQWGMTPAFYFFRDGKLVGVFSAWPDENGHDKLVAALREAGLMENR